MRPALLHAGGRRGRTRSQRCASESPSCPLARLSHRHSPGDMPQLPPPSGRRHPCLLPQEASCPRTSGSAAAQPRAPVGSPLILVTLAQARNGWGFTGVAKRPSSTWPPRLFSSASRRGGGSPALAACANPLYVVLKAYLVRKLVASRGRIWHRVLEWKILTACMKVWLVLLQGNLQLAGIQLA